MMREIHSEDYHDFVFKDGELIGEFEQMYRKSREVPWRQDTDPLRLDCRMAARFLEPQGPFHSVIEVGCGLGYFAQLLYETLSPQELIGVDVAPTAVAAAKGRFPHLHFEVLDITQPLGVGPQLEKQFDLVAIRGCFWYLFPQFDVVIDNLHRLTAPGGVVFVAQNFPPLESKFVGKDVLPNPSSLIERFQRKFEIEMTNELKDLRPGRKNDHWIMALGRRND
ncbi:MAG: class I SAM-dependent methyltransferase [Verrucomicrobiales bacterium]|nr:class I SAM-dependent methyltransferase [Verrucomicrobiales bacterium]